MTFCRFFPPGTAVIAVVFAATMGFAPPASAADKADTSSGKTGAVAASAEASPKERAEYCMKRAQSTENAVASADIASPSGESMMQSRVEQAQGFCMEGQVAEANDILMDVDAILEAKGIPNTQTLDTTETKAK